jgi:hypothetical protein
MPVLEGVASPRAVYDGVFTRGYVEVQLAMGECTQQGEGMSTPRSKRLGIAKEAAGGWGSTWNVYGDVGPKAGDVRRGYAIGGRIRDLPKTTEPTPAPGIPA